MKIDVEPTNGCKLQEKFQISTFFKEHMEVLLSFNKWNKIMITNDSKFKTTNVCNKIKILTHKVNLNKLKDYLNFISYTFTYFL